MSIHNLNFKYSTVKYKERHRKYLHEYYLLNITHAFGFLYACILNS